MDWLTAFLFVIVGAGIGYLIANLPGWMDKGDAETELEKEENAGDDSLEVVRLLRDPQGKILPEVEGVRLQSLSDLDVEMHPVLLRAVKDFLAWLRDEAE